MRVGPRRTIRVLCAERAAVARAAARRRAAPLAPADVHGAMRLAGVRDAALGETAVRLTKMVDEVDDARVVGPPPSEEGHAARRADGDLAEGEVEGCAARGQRGDVRRVALVLPVGGELGAQVIHQEVQHVLGVLAGSAARHERGGREPHVSAAAAVVDTWRVAGGLHALQPAAARRERALVGVVVTAGRVPREENARGIRDAERVAGGCRVCREGVGRQVARGHVHARLTDWCRRDGERRLHGGGEEQQHITACTAGP